MTAKRKRSATETAVRTMTKYVSGVHHQITTLVEELRPVSQLFETFEKRLIEHEVLLERVRLTNEMVEQTLLNCLQAIRQNEALQAWYPAQRGFREQKVVGPHPMWVEQRLSEDKAVNTKRRKAAAVVANEAGDSDG